MAEKTFKIGDTVKVTVRGEYYEKTGEITGVEIGQDCYIVRFYHDKSVSRKYSAGFLELVEPAPKFRLGDVVRYVDQDGGVSTSKGVVTEQRLHPFPVGSPSLAFFTYKVKFPNLDPAEYGEDKLVSAKTFQPKTIKIANGTTVRIVRGEIRSTFPLPRIGQKGRVISSKEEDDGVLSYGVLFQDDIHYFYAQDELEMVMTSYTPETPVEQETPTKRCYTYDFLNSLSREELARIKNKELDRIQYNEGLKQETIAQILQYQQADILSDLLKKEGVSNG